MTILLFGMPGGLFMVGMLLVGMFLFAIWIWTIIDIIKGEFRDNNEKVLWILLVVLLPFIGTVLYFIMGSKNRIA